MLKREETAKNKIKKKKPKKKVVNTKNKRETTEKVPTFGDPTKTLWGKIIVWILIAGMGALVIVSAVVLIYKVVTG